MTEKGISDDSHKLLCYDYKVDVGAIDFVPSLAQGRGEK